MAQNLRNVPFTILKARAARASDEISVQEGDTGVLLHFDGNFAHVKLSDGSTGRTAENRLQLGAGWGYVCHGDYTPHSSDKFTMPIKSGEYGKVIRFSSDKKWVQITIPKRNAHGWVDPRAVMFGTGRKYGDWKVKNKNALSELNGNVQQTDPSKGKTWRTIKALVDAFAQNQDKLALLNEQVVPLVMTEEARLKSTKLMTKGIELAGQLRQFDNDDVTADNFMKHGKDASKAGASLAGIYTRLYTLLRKLGPANKAYTGSATDMPTRDDTHEQKLKQNKTTSLHGRVFRDARKRYVYQLCVLEQNESLLLLAEQVLMLMMGSYDERVLRHMKKEPAPVSAGNGTAEDAAEDLSRKLAEIDEPELDNDVNEEDLADAQGKTVDEGGEGKGGSESRWRAMKETAAQIVTIANQVFQQVGWVPVLQRPEFGGKHGKFEGINIHSPLAEVQSRLIITKTVIPGKMIIWRKAAVKCRTKATTKYVGAIGGFAPGRKEFYIHKDQGPPSGTRVHLIFEQSLDGPHPKSYARLMGVCLMSDADRASTLGIRIEWQEDGVWKTLYLQSEHSPARGFDTVPGSITALGISIGILNLLKRQVITQGRRPIDILYGRVRMFDISFDNLTQSLILQEDTTLYQPVKAGKPRDKKYIVAELQAAGAQNVDGAWGTTRPDSSSPRCDRCFLIDKAKRTKDDFFGYTSEAQKVCDRPHDNGKQCTHCGMYGIPCSYTSVKKLEGAKGLSLRQAIWFPAAHNKATLDIPSPEIEAGFITQASDRTPTAAAPWTPATGHRGAPSGSNAGQSGQSSVPGRRPGTGDGGQVLDTASKYRPTDAPRDTRPPPSFGAPFDIDSFLALLKRGTWSYLCRAYGMVAPYVRANPHLNISTGAQARDLLMQLRAQLSELGQQGSAEAMAVVQDIDALDVQAGRSFVLDSFMDADGHRVRNRAPNVAEVVAFVQEKGWGLAHAAQLKELYIFLKSLGGALGSDTTAQRDVLLKAAVGRPYP
ncbi:hypothetical protein LTS10_006922 [Elasticomyces elasticus]|nr:hypothetical protein LTS10_006922 [Elasticomyces elasticus]